jgi:hypothetical protein
VHATTEKIGGNDFLYASYWSKYPKNWKKMNLQIQDKNGYYSHKLVDAKIKFVKKEKGKVYTYTKIFKGDKSGRIEYNPKKGYKPFIARVEYIKKKKTLLI